MMLQSYLLLRVTYTIIKNGNRSVIRHHTDLHSKIKLRIFCCYNLKRSLRKIIIILLYVPISLKHIGIRSFFRSSERNQSTFLNNTVRSVPQTKSQSAKGLPKLIVVLCLTNFTIIRQHSPRMSVIAGSEGKNGIFGFFTTCFRIRNTSKRV